MPQEVDARDDGEGERDGAPGGRPSQAQQDADGGTGRMPAPRETLTAFATWSSTSPRAIRRPQPGEQARRCQRRRAPATRRATRARVVSRRTPIAAVSRPHHGVRGSARAERRAPRAAGRIGVDVEVSGRGLCPRVLPRGGEPPHSVRRAARAAPGWRGRPAGGSRRLPRDQAAAQVLVAGGHVVPAMLGDAGAAGSATRGPPRGRPPPAQAATNWRRPRRTGCCRR